MVARLYACNQALAEHRTYRSCVPTPLLTPAAGICSVRRPLTSHPPAALTSARVSAAQYTMRVLEVTSR